MESAKLQSPLFECSLCRSPLPHDAHRGFRHALLSPTRLPACLLSVLSRPCPQGTSLPACHRAAVGQLSRAGLRLENHSWQRRGPQRFSPISASHARTRCLLPLQPFRGRSHAHAHLHAICVSSHLRRARAYTPPTRRSLRGPRVRPHADLPASDSASVYAWLARRSYVCFRPVARRLPRAPSGRRPLRHHDCKRRANPLRRSLRLATRRDHFRLHPDPHGFPALPQRTSRKALVLQMTASFPTRRAPLLATYAAFVFAFIYLPIVVLILYSFNRDGVGGFPPRHLTLNWYAQLFAGLQKVDRAQEEASLDLGATPWQTFWRITLPNLKLSLIAAGLLIFTLSMDEIAVTFFLIGRDNTLPLEIWGRLRRGITPEINAVSSLIFAVSVGLIIIWYRIRTRGLVAKDPAEKAFQAFPEETVP